MSLRQIKLWYKRLTCKHHRRAKFFPQDVTWWNTKSGVVGKHNTVLIEGCLTCHKVWMKDFGE